MWNPEHRAVDRRGLRYPSDLTDAERALMARSANVREVLNAIFYVLWTGRVPDRADMFRFVLRLTVGYRCRPS